MTSSFTLRMQFGPHQDPELVKSQLLKLARETPVDEVMFFFFAEELNDGHETLDQVKEWIERSRPYRLDVARAGIAVSLNPWHSILHTDRARRLKPGQDWRNMMDQNGRKCSAVICPLDPKWRDYFEETLRLYAREGFRVIWIDDDIRFHNHHPLDWGGCFCDAHVAEFNRRAGVKASREEIVAMCTAPGTPHPWRNIWMDMWDETQLAMISRWREIVEAGGSRLGLMSSTPEAHAAEGRRWNDWWRAFAGKGTPIHRPHFWGYGDMDGSSLANSIALLDQNRRLQPEDVESGPEIECFTYGRWNKSFRQTGAQMALAHILGSTNLNISLYDFMGNDPDDEPERAVFLKEWRPALDWLADEFPMSLRSAGVGLPFSENMGRAIRTAGAGRWQALTCPSRGWANWLGAAGLAFSTAPSLLVNALAGPMAWSFTDDELRGWLAQGMLLDGAAAHILLERGMGSLIGVSAGRMITQEDSLYSVENSLDAEFTLRENSQMTVNARSYSERMFQGGLMPGARAVSELRGPRQNVVGHGLVIFENELGGRTAIMPWNANAGVLMSIHRAVQLRKTVRWLARGESTGAVEGGPWLVPQFLTDGSTWRGAVWNASPDDISDITVHPPSGMKAISSAVHIDAHGKRFETPVVNGRINLKHPMRQWEFAVLM